MKSRVWRSTALLGALLPLAAIAEVEDDGSVDLSVESRTFVEAPRDDRQKPDMQTFSAAIAPEFSRKWDGGQSIVFEGFARVDQVDDERTYGDVRDLFYSLAGPQYDLSIGVRRVFWGVTEAAHLVDIVNQSHLAENLDGEDKLGQPMARLAWIIDPGVLEFYLLPFFRERPFPGVEGRLRPFLPVDTDHPEYESGDEDRHVDGAVRYAHSVAGWDFGLSYFDGTGREPRLLTRSEGTLVTGEPPPECAITQLPDPVGAVLGGLIAPDCEQYFSVTLVDPYLVPAYDQVRQYGLEVQRLSEGWFLKLEAIYRQSDVQSYAAAAGGFEYTFGGVFESAVDLTLVMEYLWDERGSLDPDSPQGRALRRFAADNRTPGFTVDEAQELQGLKPKFFSPFQDDAFVGMRIALNDEASTEALIGSIFDPESHATLASAEASRRIAEDWKLAIEGRWFHNLPVTDPLYSFERDSYLQLELTRYF